MELSKKSIVRTAMDILNREGIGKLSMRPLAAALGVKAAALYWHIKDKRELYSLIAEEVCAGIKPTCGLSDAKKYLLESARIYRENLLALRDSVEIFIYSSPSTPIRFELIKSIMICLIHLGIKEENCLIAAGIFNNYVLSFAADEARFRSLPPGAFYNGFDGILGTEYAKLSFDEQFERGLEVLFTGFDVLKSKRKPGNY